MDLLGFMAGRWPQIVKLTLDHLELVFMAVILAVAIGVAVGILMHYHEPTARIGLAVAGVIMTIPSLALLVLFIPLLHIGFWPALVGLVLYSLLPIMRNTYTGLREVDPAILEAAKGMGLTEGLILTRIKLPLALPVIMAGVRTSVVMGVGIAAVAASIGAGGLGEFIFRGISRANPRMILTGAIMVSTIAIAADYLLGFIEYRLAGTRRKG